jgi:hypothetical protein
MDEVERTPGPAVSLQDSYRLRRPEQSRVRIRAQDYANACWQDGRWVQFVNRNVAQIVTQVTQSPPEMNEPS